MEPTDAQESVICDAGPLIHLDELGSLDLLADFGAVLVPDTVWKEVERHRPTALTQAPIPLVRCAVAVTQEAEFQTLVKVFALGAGEQAALSWLRLHPAAIFLSDDAAARLAAKTLGLRSYGTIGVLLRALRRGQRSKPEVMKLLEQVPTHSTLHIRSGLLAEIIREVEDLSE